MSVPFSYAQAAKGLTSSKPSNSSSRMPSGPITPASPGAPATESTSSTIKPDDDAPTSRQKEAEQSNQLPTPADFEVQKPKPESTASISPPSMAYIESSTSTLQREDDAASIPNTSSESTWENISQASNAIEKSADLSDTTVKDKAKDMKDSWIKVDAPKKEHEAPVPAVNVWKARMEQANAKTSTKKPQNMNTSNVGKAATLRTGGQTDNSAKKPDQATSRSKEAKRDARSEEETKPKRTPKKDEKPQATPPPLQDEVFWPTPEHAVEDDRKKPAEKVEKIEPTKSSHKKPEWKKVDVQHSVVWNTPLPNGLAKRGGRGGARGGRESSSRTSPAGSRPVASPTDRNGGDTASNWKRDRSGRSASPRGKRSVSEETPVRRESKTPAGTSKDVVNGGGRSRPTGADERAPAANTLPRTGGNPTKAPRKPENGVDADKFKSPVIPNGQRATPENGTRPTVEEFVPAAEEEKRVFTDSNNPKFPPRNGNTFNNRRQSMRGRNGHHGFSSHQNSPNLAHGFQNGALGTRSPTMGYDMWGRNQNNFRGRGPGAGDPYGRYPNNYMANGALPSLNTYVAPGMYDFTNQSMSAVPYSATIDPYNLTGMVSVQLEYYFSIDNLCRDIFLRGHMDSEGFIPLDLIAGFHRVKILTTDMEMIKYVCRESHNLEHRLGVDGIDRVRKREGWEKWILEMNQRDPKAQHEGVEAAPVAPMPHPAVFDQFMGNGARNPSLPLGSPGSVPPFSNQIYQPEYFRSASGNSNDFAKYQMSPPPMSHGFAANGSANTNHRVQSPGQYAGYQPNGHPETQRDAMSDAQVDTLKVMYRNPDANGSVAQIPAAQTLSNGNVVSTSMEGPQGVNGVVASSLPNGASSSHE
ncbi:hypothetical protein BT63DRAFT_290359 [Microthyrium microscopicum]|uniref:HTH La-type RNA-binding domain-containing protein n=1 Tax=Microthyrium microscopicum TaxID=703497 RepID=A0A6A6U7T3_9PEZI|nr:hypothetical protein BT63DRAFT_290359 [Microthyrium microscopicum]